MAHFVRVLVVVCLLAVPVLAASVDDQVYGMARELMCPVCAGQTVAESNSPLALQMKETIRERLLRGESREQILAFFVGQFGESVLAAPPRRGFGLIVWLAPLLAFLIGVVVLARFLVRARATDTGHRTPDPGRTESR